ncbi:hypothetical protein IWW38_000562, partial [Coemansia aciculifera]
MTVGRPPHDDRKPRSSTAYRNAAACNDIPSRTPSDASSDNEDGRPADSARDSTLAHATTANPGGPANAPASSSSVAGNYWRDDLSNLLTPQTVVEQAQVQRRKRNREAARRSRLKQKEREAELVERQAQLSERLKFLEQELVEWRMMNASAPNRVAGDNQPALPL